MIDAILTGKTIKGGFNPSSFTAMFTRHRSRFSLHPHGECCSLPLGVAMPRVEAVAPTYWKLPSKLTDRIIDNLHDDTRSLRYCSLVCRTWLSRARYHMFHDVSLGLSIGQGQRIRFEHFKNLLERHPHLGYFVRKLSMRGSIISSSSASCARTLARMPNVVSLTWTEAFFHPSTGFELFKHLTALHLENYGFPSLNDFVSLIGSLSRLEELSCTSVRAGECTSVITPSFSSSLPSLRRLHFDHVVMNHFMFIEWIDTNSMHAHLDSLTLFSILPGDFFRWVVSVIPASPLLRHLAVSPQHPDDLATLLEPYDPTFNSFHPFPNTQLRSLEFGDRSFVLIALLILCSLFRSGVLPTIENVTILVTDIDQFLKAESVSGWNRIIVELLSERHPSFRRFVIRVLTRTASLDYRGVELIKERFMEFHSLGLLEVEICGNKVVV